MTHGRDAPENRPAFAAQLRHPEEYPDYRFLQSQPAHYLMCREHYPQLYEAGKGDTFCRLRIGPQIAGAWVRGMLENLREKVRPVRGEIPLHFHPFQVKSLRLKRE